MPSYAHYTMLPPAVEEFNDNDNNKKHRPVYTKGELHKRLFFWACFVSILSSLISMIILSAGSMANFTSLRSPTAQPLRRPNQYMNIEKVLVNHTEPFPPLVGFPPALLQIQRSDPKRTMHEDDRGHPSSIGSIYPDDRHFVVTSQRSTIAQFRHLDYGMERCKLVVKVPVPSNTLDPAMTITDPSTINVWTLDSLDELTPSTIWDHAPARKALFATLSVSERGIASSSEFMCPSGSFTTFEFGCSDIKSCHIDFWQNKEPPHGGVHLIQFDSLISSVAS